MKRSPDGPSSMKSVGIAYGKCKGTIKRILGHAYYAAKLLPVLRPAGTDKDSIFVMVYSLHGGGAERVAANLANGLSETYHVVMFCFRKKSKEYPLEEGVEKVYIPTRLYGTIEERQKMMESYVRTYKKVRKPAAAISFMYSMNRMNVHTASGETVICSERNYPVKREPEHMEEIASLYREADHVVFQSSTVRDLFDEETASHSSIILNPVSVSCLRKEKTARRIVNIGRLNPQKNQAMLIRAFADFHAAHSDYKLSIYGEGDLYDELEALAESLGVSGSVILHGNVENIHEAASDCEMFVLSSDYEGLSNALLECMMMGMPCISTRCPGSADVIQNGENGILTDVGSEEQLSSAMALLADNAGLRESLGRAARITAENFRQEIITRQWADLIGNLRRASDDK